MSVCQLTMSCGKDMFYEWLNSSVWRIAANDRTLEGSKL